MEHGTIAGRIGAEAEIHQGPLWVELDEPPEIPDELPTLNATRPDAPVRWFQTDGADGELVYGAVGGDGGAAGPYVLGVWVLGGDRFPTFPEWTSLGRQQCLAGAIVSVGFIVGSERIEPDVGRCLLATQTGSIGNTPAAARWTLANPGGVLNG